MSDQSGRQRVRKISPFSRKITPSSSPIYLPPYPLVVAPIKAFIPKYPLTLQSLAAKNPPLLWLLQVTDLP